MDKAKESKLCLYRKIEEEKVSDGYHPMLVGDECKTNQAN